MGIGVDDRDLGLGRGDECGEDRGDVDAEVPQGRRALQRHDPVVLGGIGDDGVFDGGALKVRAAVAVEVPTRGRTGEAEAQGVGELAGDRPWRDSQCSRSGPQRW